jgi:predicted Fe-S protein YdhL (DUF1289 family)
MMGLLRMANSWLRLWHDMPTDPKWRTIARVSKQSISEVIAVFSFVLVDASANASERGRTEVNAEDVASALDLDTSAVQAILDAMESRVLNDGKVTGWEKRQPIREDDSANRSKAWREAKKAEEEAERKRTQANAEKRSDKEKDTDKDKELTALAEKDFALATWAFQKVLAVAPKTKPPNLIAWANTIRLMREQDNHTHREISEVFHWANMDDFWKTNVLSMETLRKQFAVLSAKQEAAKNAKRDKHSGHIQDKASAAADFAFGSDAGTNDILEGSFDRVD